MVNLLPLHKLALGFTALLLVAAPSVATPTVESSSSLVTRAGDHVLAGPIGPQCLQGAKYSLAGNGMKGKNITIAGAPTYVVGPKSHSGGKKVKIILFFSDVFGAFYPNNIVQQDYFASQGFHVYGIDYFLGDPIGDRLDDPTFDLLTWLEGKIKQADSLVPKWTSAVLAQHGNPSKYSVFAAGYCFGAPYSMWAGKDDRFSGVSFAHPSLLTEAHFVNLKKPLLLSCAETDSTFTNEAQHRAVEILTEQKSLYHVDIYSGVIHGFATRAELNDTNAVWAKDDAAKRTAGWFDRFAK